MNAAPMTPPALSAYAQQIGAKLSDFLRHPTKRSLLLRGKWGVGKSYFLRGFLSATCQSGAGLSETHVVYISLIGLNSIAEVEQSALTSLLAPVRASKKTRSPASGQTDRVDSGRSGGPSPNKTACNHGLGAELKVLYSSAKSFGTRAFSWLWAKGLQFCGMMAKPLKLGKYIPKLDAFYEKTTAYAAHWLLKNAVVVFDDLERRGDDLKLRQILGMVARLKEQERCRIILVSNEDALDDDEKEEFALWREKILDETVAFAPPPQENCRIVFGGKPQFNAFVDACTTLSLSNIRILWQAAWLMEKLAKYSPALDAEGSLLWERHALCLMAFEKAADDYQVDLNFLLNAKQHLHWYAPMPEERGKMLEVAGQLRQYGISPLPDLDAAIIKCIRTGEEDHDGLRAGFAQLQEKLKHHQANAQYELMWNIFNQGFQEDTQKLTEVVHGLFRSHADGLMDQQINEAYQILMRLGWPIPHDLHDVFVRSRMGVASKSRLREYLSLKISADVKREIEGKLARNMVEVGYLTLLKGIVDNWTGSPRQLEALSAFSPDQICQEISSSSQGELIDLLDSALGNLVGTPNLGDTGKAVMDSLNAALDKVAASSPLNRLRVDSLRSRHRPKQQNTGTAPDVKPSPEQDQDGLPSSD